MDCERLSLFILTNPPDFIAWSAKEVEFGKDLIKGWEFERFHCSHDGRNTYVIYISEKVQCEMQMIYLENCLLLQHPSTDAEYPTCAVFLHCQNWLQ